MTFLKTSETVDQVLVCQSGFYSMIG